MFKPNYELYQKIFASYSLLLVIFGSILNPIICYICLSKKKLRGVSTFKFLAIVSISDTFCLYMWNLEHFIDVFFHFELVTKSLFYCRFINIFLQYLTLQFSSWMWTSICLDRFLSISIQRWSKSYFSGARPFLYSFIVGFLLIALNFNTIFTNGYSRVINGTEVIFCFASSENDYFWYKFMAQVFYKYHDYIEYKMKRYFS